MTRRTTAGANAPSRPLAISQIEVDRTAFFAANAAFAFGLLVLLFLPS